MKYAVVVALAVISLAACNSQGGPSSPFIVERAAPTSTPTGNPMLGPMPFPTLTPIPTPMPMPMPTGTM